MVCDSPLDFPGNVLHASLLVLSNIAITSPQDGHFVCNACSLQNRNVDETCFDACDKNKDFSNVTKGREACVR